MAPLANISLAVSLDGPDIPSFAESWPSWAQWLLGLPLEIILTVLVGLLSIAILRRVIRSWERSVASGVPWTKRTHWGRKIARTEVGSVLARVSPLDSDRRKQRAGTISSVLRSAVTAIIGVIVVVTVLEDLGVPVGPLIASAGIAGVAIGFGAQSLVKDVLAGTFMLLEDQYGVGDVVDLGDAVGTVEAVGLRVTKVRDAAGALWFVPNGTILRVANKTQSWANAIVDIRLAYGQDVDAAQTAMLRCAAALRREDEFKDAMLSDPALDGIEDLSGGAILLRLRLRTVPDKQWVIARELRQRINAEFASRGLKMAPPAVGSAT